MSLIVRMLYVLLLARLRPRLAPGKAISVLTLLTFPNDLDINLHVNNGRYLTMCDLNRVDIFIRTGLAKLMLKNRWVPLISEHTMTYKKPLGVFQKFQLTSSITHWDERCFYMDHRFERRGKVLAEGTSKGVVRGREGLIPPERVIAELRGNGRPDEPGA